MRCSDRPSLKRQRGFTMIEVMTAAMILSGMVIGLGSGWVVADREVTHLITKQKAVFMANAEMERLVTLYGTTSFGSSGPQSTTGYTETAAFPSTRLIYPTDLSAYLSGNQDYTVNAVGSFTNNGSDFQVWVQSNTPSSLNRAYIWVDYQHNIMARISWTTSNVTPAACVVGGDGCPCLAPSGVGSSNCKKLTFYMEYPYHMVASSPVAESNLRTITLSTIVGRHL